MLDCPSEAKKGEGRRVQSESLRRCLVMRNAARRRSSHGSAMVQEKFARRPFCSMEGLRLAREIDMTLRKR